MMSPDQFTSAWFINGGKKGVVRLSSGDEFEVSRADCIKAIVVFRLKELGGIVSADQAQRIRRVFGTVITIEPIRDYFIGAPFTDEEMEEITLLMAAMDLV
jgi:hypothetical protein